MRSIKTQDDIVTILTIRRNNIAKLASNLHQKNANDFEPLMVLADELTTAILMINDSKSVETIAKSRYCTLKGE